MKTFSCRCGRRVFFDNSQCTSCGAELGFFPSSNVLTALEADAEGLYIGPSGERARKCGRYDRLGLCNWMIDFDDDSDSCRACRLNEREPENPSAEDHENLRILEAAKRRLLFTLAGLGLSVVPRSVDPRGLAFSLASSTSDEKVTIGHAQGLITLDLAEANPVSRELARVTLGENYRTVLGHFRHESGHYFWDRLVANTPALEEFRALFGDERADYASALERHYSTPAPFDPDRFITPYATAHPWEDFAETWAHYIHLVDTWETAQNFGLAPPAYTEDTTTDFERRLAQWSELMIAMNSLNRSMGQPDPYPFAIGPGVVTKLEFIERLIHAPQTHEQLPADSAPHAAPTTAQVA